jgi:hypothetical protein
MMEAGRWRAVNARIFETAEIDIPLVCSFMGRAKYRLEQKLNRSGRVSTK